MNSEMKISLWKQFGAGLDMFENALQKCPPELWDDGRNFWYIAYHTLFFLDYYLDTDPDSFVAPEPFSMTEMEADETMPSRTFTKEELLSYLNHCREKARRLIAGFDEEGASAKWKNQYREYNMFEMQLYNMRHVQHHTGQLNYLLARVNPELPNWVSQTKIDL